MEYFEDNCTCCGIDLDHTCPDTNLCSDCKDNQFATDRWSERDSILEHNERLEGLDYRDDHFLSSLSE